MKPNLATLSTQAIQFDESLIIGMEEHTSWDLKERINIFLSLSLSYSLTYTKERERDR